jgi:hypothetical protein
MYTQCGLDNYCLLRHAESCKTTSPTVAPLNIRSFTKLTLKTEHKLTRTFTFEREYCCHAMRFAAWYPDT